MNSKSVKSNNLCKSVIQTFIVKAHGGILEVESPPDGKDEEGTVFILKLPIS